MSQRRNRLPEGTVNYKEMLKEAEEEIADLQDRMTEAAAILAPDVDPERMERVEKKLDALVKMLLPEDKIEALEQELQMEAESGS